MQEFHFWPRPAQFSRRDNQFGTEGEVTILLSTYNGSRYLPQQLDSLYQQTWKDVRILVRDDGSSDDTLPLLLQAVAAGRITLLPDHTNLGPAQSFFALLNYAAQGNTDCVAFCDQDDVWLPQKIERGMLALQAVPAGRPAMYCSRIEMVNNQLEFVAWGDVPRKIGFGNALVENVATGCTIILNRAAIDLLHGKTPAGAQMHDWWCYLVLSCFGEVIFDPVSSIRYRLHGQNTVGVALGFRARFLRKLRRFFGPSRQKTWCSDHAVLLRDLYGAHIPPQHRRTLDQLIAGKTSFLRRIGLIFSGELWRQKADDNLFLRILLLLNRI